ncbi:MAG TPA: hypothetical protein VF546_03100 [Pyrinomonadaceae bacterium]|jgi:hypothetical protein
MQKEPADPDAVETDAATPAGGGAAAPPAPCDDEAQTPAPPEDGPANTGGDKADVAPPGQEPPDGGDAEQGGNIVRATLDKSAADIVASVSGHRNTVTNVSYHLTPADASRNAELVITEVEFQAAKRSYQSLAGANIAGYTDRLLSQRILLLSCQHRAVALCVAKVIAHEIRAAGKQLVTIGKNCPGSYDLIDLIEQLARPKEKSARPGRRDAQRPAATVCVWAADDATEGDASDTIMDSLFTGGARVEQYQIKLSEYGLCLICLVPPRKLQDYQRSCGEADLQHWEIDFLRPLLEEHELGQYEELAETIARQRQQELWSADDAEFHKEITKYLRAGNLPQVVADRRHNDDLSVQQLFNRQDPLADIVLYCATYYPDLSPQDFSYLVELFLGDATEEAVRGPGRPQSQTADEAASPVESVPLVRRWQREADGLLRRCRLASLTNENNQRVVDFQVDGLRSRLSRYIRGEHYFFYEANFVLMRRQGLLFSPRKRIAEGARQLLVETGRQYPPAEVANWLYEIVAEFEQAAAAADGLRERSPLFYLPPDGRVKAARHYVCHGLSLVLSRLNKEPELQEAAQLFWQRLLQTQHQWFLDLLRQVGNAAPPESLGWLRRLLDQGSEEIRGQVFGYLVGHLLRRGALVYAPLKELMQWPTTTQAGRVAQSLWIVYCLETNRQLPQRDYGRWPSAHPLFGFQSHAEAVERIDLLTGWLIAATSEVHGAGALFAIADIVAGWYFILSPAVQPEAAGVAPAGYGAAELDAQLVCRLLLASLARQLSRPHRHDLLAIWEGFKSALLDDVLRLDRFANQVAGASLNAQMMADAAAARRKLMDTRTLLGRLREDFMRRAAEAV